MNRKCAKESVPTDDQLYHATYKHGDASLERYEHVLSWMHALLNEPLCIMSQPFCLCRLRHESYKTGCVPVICIMLLNGDPQDRFFNLRMHSVDLTP